MFYFLGRLRRAKSKVSPFYRPKKKRRHPPHTEERRAYLFKPEENSAETVHINHHYPESAHARDGRIDKERRQRWR